MTSASRRKRHGEVITIGLNPAIDRIVEVPDFTIGEHQSGALVARQPAGKALNVSLALDVLDRPSIATGFVGEQEIREFENCLEACSINPQFFPVRGRTRENITIIDPQHRTQTHIRMPGFEIDAGDLVRLEQKIDRLFEPECHVIVAGSLPLGMTAEQFARFLVNCHAQSGHFCVDCSGEALQHAANLPLWLIKPNLEELAPLLGLDDATILSLVDACGAARRLVRPQGSLQNILLSGGSQGAALISEAGTWLAVCPLAEQDVRNTVGAGDCLLAGFIHAVRDGVEVPEALRYAVATASAAIQQTRTVELDPKVIGGLLEHTQIRHIDNV